MSNYVFDKNELQQHLNNAFINTLVGLRDEKYLTTKEMDYIAQHYSIIIEDTSWLPKKLAKFLGMKDTKIRYSLAKVSCRVPMNTEEDSND